MAVVTLIYAWFLSATWRARVALTERISGLGAEISAVFQDAPARSMGRWQLTIGLLLAIVAALTWFSISAASPPFLFGGEFTLVGELQQFIKDGDRCHLTTATNWYFWNTTSGNNLTTWNTLTGVGTDLNADPKFVSTATPYFYLQAGSPAINTGVNVGMAIDYAGNPIKELPDIGAYEFTGITRIPLPPSGLRIYNK